MLHLAPAQDVPQDPKWKTGGGGGDGRSLAEFATRIYADKRADPKSRELLLAFAFVITMQPTDDPKEQWHNLRTALCATRARSQYTDRLRDLIQHDAPRYIPPDHQPGGYDPSKRRCQGPRLRPYRERPWNAEQMTLPQRVAQDKREAEDVRNKENICGAPGKHRVLEKLPGTGWFRYHYFCQRHRDHAIRVQEQVQEQNALAPAPVPNAGGLLPCYYEANWEGLYRHYTWEGWEPPVYGVRADDWPVPGKEQVPQRARLRLVISGNDLEDA